jgi:hypothetical protein
MLETSPTFLTFHGAEIHKISSIDWEETGALTDERCLQNKFKHISTHTEIRPH